MNTPMRLSIPLLLALVALVCVSFQNPASAAETPNIVLIYGDDVGYGDLTCYGAAEGLTPNLDRIAAEGLRFTDAHCSSATCTPSRFSLLTGMYAFRQKGVQILSGAAGAAIMPGTPTVAGMLQGAGYKTAVVGKWHLGLGDDKGADWNGDVKPGPLEIGFDYSFLIPATGDRVPCVYLEDHRVVGLDPADPIFVHYGKGDFDGGPQGIDHPDGLKMMFSHGHNQTIVNGISRIGRMRGGTAALWKDEDMADTITEKAIAFIEREKDRPFFLYFSFHDIHVPRVPHERFVGKSGMGPRGDAIAQMDWCVGQVLDKLEALGLKDNTLVIYSSDNGPVLDDGYEDEAVEKLGKHEPAGPFRGGKYSAFEAGTRVPLLVRWPEHVEAGTVSDALVSQVDFFASFAALTGQEVKAGAAPDSEDHLAVLIGKSKEGRTELVEQAKQLSLRMGAWKYIEPAKGPAINANTNTELGVAPEPQLYDLSQDPGEMKNLANKMPDKTAEMKKRLEEIRNP